MTAQSKDKTMLPEHFRPQHARPPRHATLSAVLTLVLAAGCTTGQGFDLDLRPSSSTTLNTSDAARTSVPQRPAPDARGIISYPGYQVVVAGRAETVAQIADRLDISSDALSRANAIEPDTRLQGGELLVLPSRVTEASDTSIESSALPDLADLSLAAPADSDRASQTTGRVPTDAEPIRHRVERGETAWSIARLYDVNVRQLAEWNGLDSEYSLRQGQILLIPPANGAQSSNGPATPVSLPGQGSPIPTPPSAARPLPQELAAAAPAPAPPAAQARPTATPQPPPPAPIADLGANRTEASGARFAMPAEGRIVRPYDKGRNDGIGIGAAAGSAVRAAADGTVAAITRDTEQVPIIVLRHADNLLTVYANVEGIAVDKDQKVTRGQTIAAVRAGAPAFLHFEVRRGFESLDPMPFLE